MVSVKVKSRQELDERRDRCYDGVKRRTSLIDNRGTEQYEDMLSRKPRRAWTATHQTLVKTPDRPPWTTIATGRWTENQPTDGGQRWSEAGNGQDPAEDIKLCIVLCTNKIMCLNCKLLTACDIETVGVEAVAWY